MRWISSGRVTFHPAGEWQLSQDRERRPRWKSSWQLMHDRLIAGTPQEAAIEILADHEEFGADFIWRDQLVVVVRAFVRPFQNALGADDGERARLWRAVDG